MEKKTKQWNDRLGIFTLIEVGTKKYNSWIIRRYFYKMILQNVKNLAMQGRNYDTFYKSLIFVCCRAIWECCLKAALVDLTLYGPAS